MIEGDYGWKAILSLISNLESHNIYYARRILILTILFSRADYGVCLQWATLVCMGYRYVHFSFCNNLAKLGISLIS